MPELKTDVVEQALNNLRMWHDKKRHMPGYQYGHGTDYLCRLLDVPVDLKSSVKKSMEQLEQAHPDIYAKIASPHGWAYLQILIIRHNNRGDTTDEADTGLQKP